MSNITYSDIAHLIKATSNLYTSYVFLLSTLSDDEFSKVKTVAVTKAEKDMIERKGYTFIVVRDSEQIQLYSCGCEPFKIKIIDDGQSS